MKDRFGMVRLFVLIVGLAACRTNDQTSPTPRPDYVSVSSEPRTVSLVDLAEEPEAYAGAYLQIQGQYRRLPLLFCSVDLYPAPANWMLTSDSVQVYANGFDSQLRSLNADGLTMTVTGRWRYWQGPVGCGKRAVQQEIWYLQVDDIVSPDPVVQATLTPTGPGNDTFAAQPTPTLLPTIDTETASASPEPGSTNPPPSQTPFPSSTGTLAATVTETTTTTIAASSPSPTLTATPTGLSTRDGTATSTPAGTTTATASSVTASPTPTTTQVVAVPTATNASPTATQSPLATATSATSNFTIVDQGAIDAEELVAGFLDTRQIHSWTFTVEANDIITVSAAMPSTGDIVLAIKDNAGNQVAERNNSSAGVVETMSALPLTQAGIYRLEIRAADGEANPYALVLLYSDSYTFVAQDILDIDTTRPGSITPESDHFWFFEGDIGDSVTISVTPNDNGDLFLELYGANGDRLSDFVDDGIGGEPEELGQFELPAYGMYTIRVGEYEFGQSNYQIRLTNN